MNNCDWLTFALLRNFSCRSQWMRMAATVETAVLRMKMEGLLRSCAGKETKSGPNIPT
jgi:hypothetical protein